ncbi:MAG: M20/M25/M40 family metallo-hydrolase, partial [Pyrinomonadaceae bacterium]
GTVCVAQPKQAGGNSTGPDAERLRAHVTYLASDKLEGRRTGTPGAGLAVRYIEEAFKRYGLKPGLTPTPDKQARRSYTQQFPYVASVELGKRNAMSLKTRVQGVSTFEVPRELQAGADWMPLGWTANARVEELPGVYVGYGITATELGHDDYAGVDVKDRVVVAFAGTPDGDNPHGRFTRWNDLRFKAAAARDHGAQALVLVAREENFADDKLAKLVFDNANAGDAGIPVVAVSRQVARRALASLVTPTVTIEQLEKSGTEPQGTSGSAPPTSTTTAAPAPATSDAAKNHSAPLKDVTFTISADVARRETQADNVVGVLEGSDPKLKHETIVVGAHYDHLGRGGQGSLARKEGEIHHGADDNASGVAALLELARLTAESKVKPRRTVVFAAFGGEEEGLLGSKHYVEHPALPLAQTVAMINLDMVGRMKDNKLTIGGVGTASEWREMIAQANAALEIKVNAHAQPAASGAAHGTSAVASVRGANGAAVATVDRKERFALALSEDGFGPSDHSSFYAKQTPVLFFFTGTHEDYHRPSDTADRINYEGLTEITRFVRDLVGRVAQNDQRPTYTLAKSGGQMGRATGFRVYLGTIPSYAEGDAGLKLDGVREGSPAERAGLRAGDVIVKMAGREVRNVYDYTYLLGEMKPAQEYEVEVMRGAERLTLKLTPAARK